MAVAIAIGAAVVIGGAIAANAKAKKAEKKARSAKEEAKFQMEQALENRQDITNPYAGVTDLSSLASDLSSEITNPFNNLQVSTAAAEMQAEESDIALSNTLDTMEQTGASAGGATALAMASLRGKKDVAATIEQQEAKNAELKAGGEQAMQQAKVSATTRFQNVAIEQGARMEGAEAQGEIFQWKAQENRTNADINRYQAQYQGFAAQENAAAMQQSANTMAAASAVGGMASGASDRRLKNNIKLIGYSPSGLKIYTFEYINKLFGEGVYQGVMSDEIPSVAVIKHQDGWDRVDYSKIDVNFKKIN